MDFEQQGAIVDMDSFFSSKEDLLWYKIRDTLLGRNNVQQNIKIALELSATCKRHEAVWLTTLFAGKFEISKEDARALLLEESKSGDNAPALSFAALIEFPWSPDFLRLKRAATLGYAFAQAWCAGQAVQPTERFEFAVQAVRQGERDGFYELGHCYHFASGCAQDFVKGKEHFLWLRSLDMFKQWLDLVIHWIVSIRKDVFGWEWLQQEVALNPF